MELPPEIQAMINLFAKPITSGKWREGSFIIESFREEAAKYIEQRYEYDDLNHIRQQLYGLSYDTYFQLPFYEWLALSHVSCRNHGIPQWAINEFCDEKIAALERHRDEMERVWAQEKSELAIESAETKVTCERSAAAAAAVAAGAAEEAVCVAAKVGGTQKELVNDAVTAAATMVHNAGGPLSQEELDEFIEEIAVEAKRILKSLLPIPGPLVRQPVSEILDVYDSDGLEGYCVDEHVDNGFPEPLDM